MALSSYTERTSKGVKTMTNTAIGKTEEETRLNIRLAGPLAEHIDRRVHSQLYNTSSEYIRDLIRRDMEAEQMANIRAGKEDIIHGRYTRFNADEFEDRVKNNRRNAQKK
jgi:antitoxin ParD1/3/4